MVFREFDERDTSADFPLPLDSPIERQFQVPINVSHLDSPFFVQSQIDHRDSPRQIAQRAIPDQAGCHGRFVAEGECLTGSPATRHEADPLAGPPVFNLADKAVLGVAPGQVPTGREIPFLALLWFARISRVQIPRDGWCNIPSVKVRDTSDPGQRADGA